MAKLETVHESGTRAAQTTPDVKEIGLFYFVTDEGVMERWSGTAWVPVSGLGGHELDYVEFTSPVTVTATVEDSGDTVVTASTITPGAIPILIEFYAPFARPDTGGATGNMRFNLFEDASDIGRLGELRLIDGGERVPLHLTRRMTPAAGSRTYSIRAYLAAGTSGQVTAGVGGNSVTMPGYIRITRAT